MTSSREEEKMMFQEINTSKQTLTENRRSRQIIIHLRKERIWDMKQREQDYVNRGRNNREQYLVHKEKDRGTG